MRRNALPRCGAMARWLVFYNTERPRQALPHAPLDIPAIFVYSSPLTRPNLRLQPCHFPI